MYLAQFGMYIEGMRRLNREARELVGERLGSFVYGEVPAPFFRYSSAIELIDGKLTIPGGPEAAGMWREIVGVSPEDPAAFIKALLEEFGTKFGTRSEDLGKLGRDLTEGPVCAELPRIL